jgi:hypothetical protein
LPLIIRHTALASNPRVHILRSLPALIEEFAGIALGKLLNGKAKGGLGRRWTN